MSYKKRLEHTLEVLRKAFVEVDAATQDFTRLIKEKENVINELESRLSQLSHEESQLKRKVEVLQNVPIEAIEHFESILNKGDRRSAFRDYLLFGLGVVVSVVVTIVLKRFGDS